MKFVVGENGRNPAKNLPRLRFVHHETHMEGPRRELGTPAVGGERLTACATRPPRPIVNEMFLLTSDSVVACTRVNKERFLFLYEVLKKEGNILLTRSETYQNPPRAKL